jgi:hypothetical protein
MNSYAECKAILDLDLDPIKAKLMHRQSGEGWTPAQASAVEAEYRRFLYLRKAFPNDNIAPLEQVDTFWHYHILDTMKYAEDCEVIFGEFLHHFPYSGMCGEEDLAHHQQLGDRTRMLYLQAFGDDYYARADADGNRGDALPADASSAARHNDATVTASSAASAGTAWCNTTVSNASADGTTTAWCNTTVNPTVPRAAVTAWCNVTGDAARARPKGAATAWCNATVERMPPKRPVTASCNTTVDATGSKGTLTAWCNATVNVADTKRAVTAWCNTTVNGVRSKGAGIAWCNTTLDAAGSKGAVTAWCNTPSTSSIPDGTATAWCNTTVGSKRRTDSLPVRPRLYEEAVAA